MIATTNTCSRIRDYSVYTRVTPCMTITAPCSSPYTPEFCCKWLNESTSLFTNQRTVLKERIIKKFQLSCVTPNFSPQMRSTCHSVEKCRKLASSPMVVKGQFGRLLYALCIQGGFVAEVSFVVRFKAPLSSYWFPKQRRQKKWRRFFFFAVAKLTPKYVRVPENTLRAYKITLFMGTSINRARWLRESWYRLTNTFDFRPRRPFS